MSLMEICGASIKDQVSSAQSGTGANSDLQGSINTIINFVTGFFAVLAVIAIIIGGVQMTASQGDAGKVKKAKDTILYGIIGLVICLAAFAIANFVVGVLEGKE